MASHRVPRGEVRRPGSRDDEATVSSVICLGGERQRGRLLPMLKEPAGEEFHRHQPWSEERMGGEYNLRVLLELWRWAGTGDDRADVTQPSSCEPQVPSWSALRRLWG